MNPAPALISILMPLRNAAATVRHTLDSILAQTLRDWELVAVDDGSLCGYLARWLRANVDPTRELWLWGAGRVNETKT